MKIKRFIFVWLFICFQSSLFGQNYKLSIGIIDCADSLMIDDAEVFIQSSDTVIRFSSSNYRGGYEAKLKQGNYQLLANYYYYGGEPSNIKLMENIRLSGYTLMERIAIVY